MSILLNKDSKLVVQGITGREGSFHASQCLEYGTRIVAGVTPGKGGQSEHGVPIFDSVREAVEKTGADTSLIFVPPRFAQDAVFESAEAGVKLIVTVTEGIPAHDMVHVKDYLRRRGVRMIGPNCPGIITPGEAKAGIMPGHIHQPGRVGVVSRSGTLTYEAVYQLSQRGIGQSTCIGIGGDPVIGTTFTDVLSLFAEDPGTDAIVMIGEIGGTAEEDAAAWARDNGLAKPVISFVAGRTAPPGKRMGHAGAIVSGGRGTAREKMEAMSAAGFHVVDSPADIGETVRSVLGS